MWLSHLEIIPLGICKQRTVPGVTLWRDLDCTLIVAVLKEVMWCQGKMMRQNLGLKIEAGYKKMNGNIQHLAGNLIYLVKWPSMDCAGIPQSVSIPQRSSYGIMGQSGYPSSGPEAAEPFLSVCPKRLWRNSDLHGSHVSVLSQSPGCEVPRSLCECCTAHRPCWQSQK